MGFGGKIPFVDNLHYWVSGQTTTYDSYRVLSFDDNVYQENDIGNTENMEKLVAPWDKESGFRAFGFDKTNDVFAKIDYDFSSNLKFNVSYWEVHGHRKLFDPSYLYWDEGKNEIFTRDLNHPNSRNGDSYNRNKVYKKI